MHNQLTSICMYRACSFPFIRMRSRSLPGKILNWSFLHPNILFTDLTNPFRLYYLHVTCQFLINMLSHQPYTSPPNQSLFPCDPCCSTAPIKSRKTTQPLQPRTTRRDQFDSLGDKHNPTNEVQFV